MRTLIAFLLVSAATLMAQKPEFQEGLGQGYDGEWTHASRQLIALAEVIPPEKYSWRPAPGVRSTGECVSVARRKLDLRFAKSFVLFFSPASADNAGAASLPDFLPSTVIFHSS